MKKILVLFFTIFAFNSFACGGGVEGIQLNNDKRLVAYGLIDVSSNKTYFFSEDLEAGITTYGVKDAFGGESHIIFLKDKGSYIEVIVYDIISEDTKVYKGQFGVNRGCNELVQLN